jgi:hypothetical protein
MGALVLAALLLPAPADARGSGGGGHGTKASGHTGAHASSGTRSGSHYATSGSRGASHASTPKGTTAHSGAAHSPSSSPRSSARTGGVGSHSKAVPGVARDSHGRIARSAKAKDNFKKSHPCPSTGRSSGACPGYVIDHVKPLKRGGADAPSNMQWQTKEAAKQGTRRSDGLELKSRRRSLQVSKPQTFFTGIRNLTHFDGVIEALAIGEAFGGFLLGQDVARPIPLPVARFLVSVLVEVDGVYGRDCRGVKGSPSAPPRRSSLFGLVREIDRPRCRMPGHRISCDVTPV